MVAEPVDASRLETPLDFTPPSDSSVEKEVIGQILEAIYTSKNPVLLADVITARFHCTPEVRKLVDITQFPVSPPLKSQANSQVLRHKSWKRDN